MNREKKFMAIVLTLVLVMSFMLPTVGATPPPSEDAIQVEKEVNMEEAVVGEEVIYRITVFNKGSRVLRDVVVADDMLGGVIATQAAIATGSSMVVEIPYVIQSSDVNNGWVSNLASASAIVSSGGCQCCTRRVSDSDTATVKILDMSIDLSKYADPGPYEEGDMVYYGFRVENTGEVPLSNVEIYDEMLGGVIATYPLLGPGESEMITGPGYVVTYDDLMNDCGVYNMATAAGMYHGVTVTTRAGAMVRVVCSPGFEVEKNIVNDTGPYEVGDMITYEIILHNTGNVLLVDGMIDDDLLGIHESFPSIPSHSSLIITTGASHLVTWNDFMVGSVTNIASASAWIMGPCCKGMVSGSATVVSEVIGSPGIELIKNGSIMTGEVGDVVDYEFIITNTGNVTLENIQIVDELLGLEIDVAPLASGGSVTVSGAASHTLTADDMANGYYHNVATASAWYMKTLVTDTDDHMVTLYGTPAISVMKEADLVMATVDDEITYTITVTNEGNVPLEDVYVEDSLLGMLAGPLTIPVGGEEVLSPTYMVTLDDVYMGGVTNLVTASGMYYGPITSVAAVFLNKVEIFSEVTTAPAIRLGESVIATGEAYVATYALPEIDIVKSVDSTSVLVGSTVNYIITVTNPGNIPIYGVEIYDEMFGGILEHDHEGPLLPGETIEITGLSYTTTTVGTLTNTASVTGSVEVEIEGDELYDESTVNVAVSAVPIIVTNSPGILVSIAPDSSLVPVGTDVTFTMTVTNTGNTTLNNVSLVNTSLGFNETLTDPLYVFQSRTFTSTMTMTEALTFNTEVDATGVSPQYVTVVDDSSTVVVVFAEEEEEEEPTPGAPPEEEEEIVELTPGANPQTGQIAIEILSLVALVSALTAFMLVRKKRKYNE